MNLKFTNNASAKLAEAISSTSTTLKVESDKGSLFPSITSPEYFYVTLVGDSVMEIVKVTARNNDTFTIVRAQDGTTAQAFSTGDVVELRITAAAFNDISTALDELDAFPEQSGKSGQSLITDGTSTLWYPVAQDILDAAELASSGHEGEASIHEPLLGTVQHEMGSWWISLDNSIPTGGLPHLGHLCSRATYGDFWTWCELNKTVVSEEEWFAYADAHNGCCPYYSYGDESTTFRTPKYDQSFLKILATIGGTGEMEEAGLPNIMGRFATDIPFNHSATALGAFRGMTLPENANYGDSSVNTNTTGTTYGYAFNASSSNSIYGNSDTVTPQNYGIIVGVYAVGAVSAPIGETDAANLLNGLTTLEAGKASVDLSNLSTAGKSLASGLGMPKGRGINLTLGASGTQYTAPANGWVTLCFEAMQAYSYFGVRDSTGLGTFHVAGGSVGSNDGQQGTIAVKKGATFNCYYGGSLTLNFFRFIYAEGEEA